MAKKEIRMLVASADAAGLIDRGADVDTQLKNLTYEDKGIKAKLTEMLVDSFKEDETSIRFKGTASAAVVTVAEKVDLNCGAEKFPVVRDAIDRGVLAGVVERKLTLVVPPDKVVEAEAALKAAGIKATLAETLSVTADALRQAPASLEQGKAMDALRGCVTRDVSYRVKYERA